MKARHLLMKVAERLKGSKVFDAIAYIRTAHMNYVAFILTVINLFVIMKGIVLPRFGISGREATLVSIAIIVVLSGFALALGWIDLNVGTSRRVVEKQAYWRKPNWGTINHTLTRISNLASVVLLAQYLKERGELDDFKLSCLRDVAERTVEWVYKSFHDVRPGISLPNKECLKWFFSEVGVELSKRDLEKIYALWKKPEYR